MDDTQVNFTLAELIKSSKARTVLDSLARSDFEKCQVYMELDFIEQNLIIKFDSKIRLQRLWSVENVRAQISTTIISTGTENNMNQTSIKTVVTIVCDGDDQCDIKFIFEYFNLLILTDYKKLASTIRPLILVQSDRTNECTIGHTDVTDTCRGSSCSWFYSTDTQLGEGNCEYIDLRDSSILHVITDIRMFVKRKEQHGVKPSRAIFKYRSSITFWCQLNNCNNQKVGKLVEEAVGQRYSLWAIYHTKQLDTSFIIR